MLWRRAKTLDIYPLTADIAIGPAPDGRVLKVLAAEGYRGLVDLRAEGEDRREPVQLLGLDYLRLPVVDGEAPALAELHTLTRWVSLHVATSGPVFLHCREGRGRSATVAVASLVRLGLPLGEAYKLLMRARPDAIVNAAQAASLEAFATDLKATKAAGSGPPLSDPR